MIEKKTIVAAGGLVLNANGDLLMIYRRGKWDLPKGKLDAGETIEDCAVREVTEETGLQEIQLGKFIGKTYHSYFDQWMGEEVIKETWWYSMKAPGEQKLVPQTEEDIEHIIWADAATIQENLQNSFPNIIEIVHQFQQAI